MAARGTTSYIYFMDQSLGLGATGNVYFGRHKKRGEPCAIKVFRTDCSPNQVLLREREFEVMRRLSHENIVKFLAIEPESHGKDRVLVLELCTGGSVYKILEEPENAFGFKEEEFLVFLRDITKAFKYLRQEQIVHRDIKPGNILRYIKDDLSSVYKLTDFGAARSLPEDGEFMSLYGTEEYLHPDVYKKALLGHRYSNPAGQKFDASVDLWSLGVTLYHVATGRLPFQPYGGRKNKESMHIIISQKKPGFISGVQQEMDGPIEWSRELPRTCLLSKGLKRLLVPMLMRLLENDDRHRWNFDGFFSVSTDITSRNVVHVFSLTNFLHDRLYIGREERNSLAHIQESLAELISLPSNSQILLHEHYTPEEIFSNSGDGIPKTTAEEPLIIAPKYYKSSEWSFNSVELPKSPELPSVAGLVEDATYSRMACAVVIFIMQKSKYLVSMQALLVKVHSMFEKQLSTDLQQFHVLFDYTSKSCSKLKMVLTDETNRFRRLFDQIKNLRTLQRRMREDFNKVFICEDNRRLLSAISKKSCQPGNVCVKRQKKLAKDLRTTNEIFKQQKHSRDLSYNDQQIHKFDKTKIGEIYKKSFQYFNEHCFLNSCSTAKAFQTWFEKYLSRRSELEALEQQLQQLQQNISIVEDGIFKIQSSVFLHDVMMDAPNQNPASSNSGRARSSRDSSDSDNDSTPTEDHVPSTDNELISRSSSGVSSVPRKDGLSVSSVQSSVPSREGHSVSTASYDSGVDMRSSLHLLNKTLKENSISLGDAKIKSEENARYFERLKTAATLGMNQIL